MNYDVNVLNPIARTDYDQYFNKIVKVVVNGEPRPIAGRLIKISDRFLTLEHRSGRATSIREADIITVAELPEAA